MHILFLHPGGNPGVVSETLRPPDLQCAGVHPQPRSGPPGCQAWKHPAAGHSLPSGQAGRLWPCPEERNPHPLHHRDFAVHGPRTLQRGSAGQPDRGDSASSERGAQLRHLGLCSGHLLHPHRLLPMGALHGLGQLLSGVCWLVRDEEESLRGGWRPSSVEEVHPRGHGDVPSASGSRRIAEEFSRSSESVRGKWLAEKRPRQPAALDKCTEWALIRRHVL